MQNCPKCVVMETRYMVDTTSQELPVEEKIFMKLSFSSALFFFCSKDDNGTSNFADFRTTLCISNCVRSFFFFKPWLALCGVDFWEKMKNSSPNQQSANSRPTVGQQPADSWPTVSRLLANCRPTVGRLSFTAFYENLLPTVGRLLAACR